MDDSLSKLANPPFDITWEGTTYQVKKATLEKIAQLQERARTYVDDKDKSPEPKLIAFALWLVLKDKVQGLTEEQVLQNTPAIDFSETMVWLGFTKPAKENPIQEPNQTSETSTVPSQTELDGPQ